MWGTIRQGCHIDNVPTLRDEGRIVAVFALDATGLEWLVESLDPNDEVTKSLVLLREKAKDYLWTKGS